MSAGTLPLICPDGGTRYPSGPAAVDAARSLPGRVVVRCEGCAGWHLERKPLPTREDNPR